MPILTREEVRNIPEVEPTKSWSPVHHNTVIDIVDYTIKDAGLGVRDLRFDVSENGKDLFAVAKLDAGPDHAPWAVGFRNSMQKRFAVGLCSGNNVLVCSNMCFKGDFIEFKKHTSGLDEARIKTMAVHAIQQIIEQCRQFDSWFANLKERALVPGHFKALTFNAMASGAVAPSEFNNFLLAYDEEKQVNQSTGTLIDFHGAATRLMRNKSLFVTQERSQALNRVCDEYMQAVGV